MIFLSYAYNTYSKYTRCTKYTQRVHQNELVAKSIFTHSHIYKLEIRVPFF